MADIGSFNNLLGENVFTRNNLLPRWERFHNYYITVYVIFVIIFGFTDSVGSPHCLPLDENMATEMNEGEYAFADAYCLRLDDDITPQVRLFILFLALLAAVIANRRLEAKEIESSVNAFSDAQNTIESLGLSLEELKQKAISPVFDRKGSQSAGVKIRQVIINLISYNSGDPTKLLLRRGWTTVIILLSTFIASVILWMISTYQIYFGYDYFYCDVYLEDDFEWSGNFFTFICTRPDTDFDYVILILCGAAIFGHFEVSWQGVRKLRQIKSEVGDQIGDDNNEFSTASRCMLFLAKMNTDAGRKESIFSEFVEFIFDKNTMSIVERMVPEACGFYGNETDEELVYIYGCMAGKQRLEDFLKKYEDELIEHKKWKSLVILLNMFPETTTCSYPISDIILAIDDAKNNILFYALDRKPGVVEFTIRAAVCILCQADPAHRIVLHEDREISVKDFVQSQFDKDPTYPKWLKELLLHAGETENASDSKIDMTVDDLSCRPRSCHCSRPT